MRSKILVKKATGRRPDDRYRTGAAGRNRILTGSGKAATWALLLCILILFPHQAMGEEGQNDKTAGNALPDRAEG